MSIWDIVKSKIEKTSLLPFLPPVQVPIGVKASVLSLAIPGAAAKFIPVAKAIISHPIKAFTIGSGSLLGLGILKESKKARAKTGEVLTSLPSRPGQIVELGEKIGKKIEGEDVEVSPGEAFKTAGKAGAVAAGVLLIPKVVKKFKSVEIPDFFSKPKDIKEQMPSIIEAVPELPASVSKQPEALGVVPTLPEIPLEQPGELNKALLPETVDITPKKRKKSKRKAVSQNVIKINNYLSVENYI